MFKHTIFIVFIFLFGCATTKDLQQGSISAQDENTVAYLSSDGKRRHTYLHNGKLCAEPSPDVMNAIARSLSAQLEVMDKGSLGFQSNIVETVAEIGKRTPTIQLIRDALYRICEGSANGAISDEDYESLNRLYQQSMVALVAIESLTKTNDPTSAVLSAKSTMDGANSLHETWKKLGEQKKTAIQTEKMKNEANKKVDEQLQKTVNTTVKTSPTIDYKAACKDDANSANEEEVNKLKKTDGKDLSEEEVNKLKNEISVKCKKDLMPLKVVLKTESEKHDAAIKLRDGTQEHYNTIAKTLGSTIESQVTIIHPDGTECKDNKNDPNCQVRVRPAYSIQLIKTVENIVLKTMERGSQDRCLSLMQKIINLDEEIHTVTKILNFKSFDKFDKSRKYNKILLGVNKQDFNKNGLKENVANEIKSDLKQREKLRTLYHKVLGNICND